MKTIIKALSNLTIINGFTSLLNFVLGLAIIKLYSESLRADIIYSISLATLIVTIATFGRINGINYYFKKFESTKRIYLKLTKYFFISNLIVFILIKIDLVKIDNDYLIFFVLISQLAYLTLKPNFINYRKFVSLLILTMIYPIALMVALANKNYDNAIVILFSVESLLVLIVGSFYLSSIKDFRLSNTSNKVVRIYSNRSYVSTLLNVLYHRYDIIILAYLITENEYITYVVLKSIVSVQLLITNSINSLAYGFLLETKEKKRLVKQFVFLNLIISVGVSLLLVNALVIIINPYLELNLTYKSIEVYSLVLGFMLYSISTPFTSYFNSIAKQKYNTISITICLIMYTLLILLNLDVFIAFVCVNFAVLIIRLYFYVNFNDNRSQNTDYYT